jgi:hypothetical protein
MTTILTQYLVPCITEGINVETDFKTSFPTVCPNCNTHIIDPSGIQVIDTISSNIVTVNQNAEFPTGGFYRADQYQLAVTGGTGATGSINVSYPYNTGIYSITIFSTNDNVGDSFNILLAPNNQIGTLSAPLNIGDTTLTVSSAVGFNPGFYLFVTDGVNTNDLGIITNVDLVNGIISFTNSASNNFASGSQISITTPIYQNGLFVNNENIKLAENVIANTDLPANQQLQFNYINSNGNPKTFNFILELQY